VRGESRLIIWRSGSSARKLEITGGNENLAALGDSWPENKLGAGERRGERRLTGARHQAGGVPAASLAKAKKMKAEGEEAYQYLRRSVMKKRKQLYLCHYSCR